MSGSLLNEPASHRRPGLNRFRSAGGRLPRSLRPPRRAAASRRGHRRGSRATATTATILAGLGLRLVDPQGTALEVLAIDGVDGLLGSITIRHLDEPETLRLTGDAIHHDARGADFPVGGEERTEIIIRGLVRSWLKNVPALLCLCSVRVSVPCLFCGLLEGQIRAWHSRILSMYTCRSPSAAWTHDFGQRDGENEKKPGEIHVKRGEEKPAEDGREWQNAGHRESAMRRNRNRNDRFFQPKPHKCPRHVSGLSKF